MTENGGDQPALADFGDDFSSVLCVVAHPDDIEYGTAAAVAKWTAAGKAVTYFLLTRGEAGIDTMHPDEAAGVREQEERDGAAIVGVTEVDFGRHRDGTVEYGLGLRRDIAREIRRRKPDVVVTGHYGDRFVQGMLNQADHVDQAVASLEAHRAYNSALPDTFPEPAELIGMILGWGGQAAGVDKALTLDVVAR